MNKKRVKFHESVKKEDGNSIKRLKIYNSISTESNTINKFIKLDKLLEDIKNDIIKLSNISKSILLELKDYCSIDYDIRNSIIQELISRDN